MLVLSRKKSEAIVVGEELIEIVVVEIRGDKVRLGIQAAPALSVHRREVYDAIRRNQRLDSRSISGELKADPTVDEPDHEGETG